MKQVPPALAALLLMLMAILAGGAALRESITVDEVAHIGAGVSYLQKLDLRLNQEHPPLAKVLAAVPLFGEYARTIRTRPGPLATLQRHAWRIALRPLRCSPVEQPSHDTSLGTRADACPHFGSRLVHLCLCLQIEQLLGRNPLPGCLVSTPAFLIFGLSFSPILR